MSNIIKSKNLYLRPLTIEDVSDTYISWLNNPEVNRYLVGVSREKHDSESVCNFIKNINTKNNEFIFGIFLNNSNKHIGNIKVGPIVPYHLVADVGFLIGEQSQWGKGYGSEAIKALSGYCFNTLKLNKLTAGLYISNIACGKALEKAGFKKEGHRVKHYLLDGMAEDIIEYGACQDSWGSL